LQSRKLHAYSKSRSKKAFKIVFADLQYQYEMS